MTMVEKLVEVVGEPTEAAELRLARVIYQRAAFEYAQAKKIADGARCRLDAAIARLDAARGPGHVTVGTEPVYAEVGER